MAEWRAAIAHPTTEDDSDIARPHRQQPAGRSTTGLQSFWRRRGRHAVEPKLLQEFQQQQQQHEQQQQQQHQQQQQKKQQQRHCQFRITTNAAAERNPPNNR